MHRIFLLATVGVLLTSPVFAQKATQKELPREARGSKKRIEVLVGMLASKNKAPEERGFQDPEGYDEQAQAVVYLAIQQLLGEGSGAFDELIKHFEDKRYCYTYEDPSGRFNASVGKACRQIMWRSVECYEGELHYITGDQAYRFLHSKAKDGQAKWWTTNRERPLWKIQVEAIDEAIAFFDAARTETSRSVDPFAGKLPAEKFDELRKDNIRLLKARRASIVAVEEPYRPRDLEYELGTMTLLPWPEKSNFGR